LASYSQCRDGIGEDEETKKQKQKALIDAAFKVKSENSENSANGGGADGNDESDDGEQFICYFIC